MISKSDAQGVMIFHFFSLPLESYTFVLLLLLLFFFLASVAHFACHNGGVRREMCLVLNIYRTRYCATQLLSLLIIIDIEVLKIYKHREQQPVSGLECQLTLFRVVWRGRRRINFHLCVCVIKDRDLRKDSSWESKVLMEYNTLPETRSWLLQLDWRCFLSPGEGGSSRSAGNTSQTAPPLLSRKWHLCHVTWLLACLLWFIIRYNR